MHSTWTLPTIWLAPADQTAISVFKDKIGFIEPCYYYAPRSCRKDLFTWLSYRCYIAKGEERIPIFAQFGLANQLGYSVYSRPRRFREQSSNG